jgi:hypothetical protein
LLKNGGITGGWEDIDHNLFLQIRNTNKNKDKSVFINELDSLIATKSREQVEQHENWYQQFIELNNQKKEAIKEWRLNKKVVVFISIKIFILKIFFNIFQFRWLKMMLLMKWTLS